MNRMRIRPKYQFKKPRLMLFSITMHLSGYLRVFVNNIYFLLRIVDHIVKCGINTGVLVYTGQPVPSAYRTRSVPVRDMKFPFPIPAHDTLKIPVIGE